MVSRDKIKGFIVGVIITALLTTTVFAAPIKKTISVVYNGTKIYVDGNLIHPVDTKGNPVEPFAYNGTNYLPVRAVSEALGKTVKWDSKANSIYIGKAPTGQYMSDILKPYYDSGFKYEINQTMSMSGKKYYKGYRTQIGGWYFNYIKELSFNLNSQYTNITGLVGLEDNKAYHSVVKVTILGDDNILTEMELKGGEMPSNLNIDVKNISKLTIQFNDDASPDFDTYLNFANLMIK